MNTILRVFLFLVVFFQSLFVCGGPESSMDFKKSSPSFKKYLSKVSNPRESVPNKTSTSLKIFPFQLSKDELKGRVSSLLSKTTHKRLSRALSFMGQDKIDSALSILKRLLKSTENRPGEKARVFQALGFAHGQKQNYKKARRFFYQSIGMNVLDYSSTLTSLYNLAQMDVTLENYVEALKSIDLWLSLADEPSPEAYILKASILAQEKKYKKALNLINKALALAPPRESWLAFAVAMNYELKKYFEAMVLLEKLVAQYPEKKKYWKQLVGVYLQLDKNQKALATIELAYKAQYLEKDSEFRNLVTLLIYGGIPLKAAQLLQKFLKQGLVKKTQKNYEILGDAWFEAEEIPQALQAYKESAKRARDGRIFAKQGRIYLEQEKWSLADKYLTQGLTKGKVKNPQNILMSLGVARFHLKKFVSARKAFRRALKISPRLKSQVQQWIQYVDKEEKT